MKENLKSIFALPKWAKIFLAVLSVVAVAGLITAFGLKAWAADKVESGELVLNGIDKGMQERLDSGFAYDGRLYFARLDFLLRSKVIAYIDIVGISWGENVDKNAISEITSQNRHIKFITSQDLQGLNAQNIGKVEYKMDFSPLFKTIIKYYFAIAFFVLAVQILWNFFVITWRSLPPKIDTTANSLNLKPLTRKDYAFLGFAFVLCAGICAFTFWLGFPGYIWDGDIFNILFWSDKSNYSPIMNTLFFEFFFLLFGKHTYFIFLTNSITLYFGLWFFIAGFYIRFRSAFSLAVLMIVLIGNISLSNFISMNYILMANFIFCAYSVIFFIIFAREILKKWLKIALWILAFACLFFGILWRHNAIFSAFPAFFIICYLFLQNRGLKLKAFIKLYFILVILSAMLCLIVVIGFPKAFASNSNPQTHLLLLQMAGACVTENDASCFKGEWYKKDKNFEDVKTAYADNPLGADIYKTIFSCSEIDIELKGLTMAWLKSITKYPQNFLVHELRFFKAVWWQNPRDGDTYGAVHTTIKSPKTIQQKPTEWPVLQNLHPIDWVALQNFPSNEWSITFTPLQDKIYTAMYEHLPVLSYIVFISISFVVLLVSVVVWAFGFAKLWINSKELLIFTFSASLTAFASAVIIAGLASITWSRYMSPVPILSLVALIGFFAFVLESLCANRLLVKK